MYMNLIEHITNYVKIVYILERTKPTYRIKYLQLQLRSVSSFTSLSKNIIDHVFLKAIIKYTFKSFYLFFVLFFHIGKNVQSRWILDKVLFITSAFLTFNTHIVINFG